MFSTSSSSFRSLFIFFIAFSGFLLPAALHAQLKGKVVFEKDARPAAFATVNLSTHKGNSMSLTDKGGNFSFSQKDLRSGDTLSISMVGYKSIHIPVAQALKMSQYELVEYFTSMEPVKVKFMSSGQVGDARESQGFFRSWSTEKNGGEIGRILYVPYDEYKLDKIRFKVNNHCDVCMVRLHIHTVLFGFPGKELLQDSIVVPVRSMAVLDDKATEFDLSKYNLVLNQRNIFVGLEIVEAKKPGSADPKSICSFSFAGTEKGEYFYKPTQKGDWKKSEEYTIFIKAAIRY